MNLVMGSFIARSRCLALAAVATVAVCGCRSTPGPAVGAASDVITVSANWAGADPNAVAELLARPLETELASLDGVSRMTTRCDTGNCLIRLRYPAGADGDRIAFEAHSAVKRAERNLPDGARVTVLRCDRSGRPGVVIALVLDTDRIERRHYDAAHDFAYQLMRLPQAVAYEIPGTPEHGIEVVIDRERALKYGVSPADAARAIQRRVVRTDPHTRLVIGVQTTDKEKLPEIVIKKVGKLAVRVKDVATISRGEVPGAVYRVDGRPAVLVHFFLPSDATRQDAYVFVKRVLETSRPSFIKKVIPLSVR
jgi:multidrug efflux pump subunit AcrB